MNFASTAANILGSIARGFTSGPVSLGNVTLQGVEVPSDLSFSGEQQLVVHRLPGGGRIINTMGTDPASIAISGLFTGPLASSRYASIEAMRDAGEPVLFSAAGRALLVIIAACQVSYQQRGAVLPFRIVLEIVPQLVSSQPTDGSASYVALTASDVAAALAAAQVGLTISSADAGLASAAIALAPLSGVVAGSAAYAPALDAAGAGLNSSIATNGLALETIGDTAANGVCGDAVSLASAVQAAGLLANATQAGGYVNRALASTVISGSLPAPLIHS